MNVILKAIIMMAVLLGLGITNMIIRNEIIIVPIIICGMGGIIGFVLLHKLGEGKGD